MYVPGQLSVHSLQLGDALDVAHINLANSHDVKAVVYTDFGNNISVRKK